MHINQLVVIVAFVMIVSVATLTVLPLGIPAHATPTINFGLSESVYDLGSDFNVQFSFTGKVVGAFDDDDTSGSLLNVVVKKEHGPQTLLSGLLDSENQFVTSPRIISDVFKTDGQYTATAFLSSQSVENGSSIKLEFKNNLLYEHTDYQLLLNDISDRTVDEGETVSFTIKVRDSSVDGIVYKFSGIVHPGATLDPNTGLFSWTPDSQKGSKTGALYKFQVTASKVQFEDTKTFTITVIDSETNSVVVDNDAVDNDAVDNDVTNIGTTITTGTTNTNGNNNNNAADPPIHTITLKVPALFVDANVDSQTYVDRYNTDDAFKAWFDEHYSEYDSIYHAVGLPDPDAIPSQTTSSSESNNVNVAPFVDPSVDPQTYIDRYNNEPQFKAWFDDNYASEYSTIYDAVGLLQVPASFVDPSVDPQTYIDRYNNEPQFKAWFDEHYSEYDSIYHAVGLPIVVADEDVMIDTGSGDDNTIDDNTIDDNTIDDTTNDSVDDNSESDLVIKELPPPVIAPGAIVPSGLELQPGQEFGQCGEGTELVDNYCVIIGTEPPPSINTASASDDDDDNNMDINDVNDDTDQGGCLIATAVYGSEMAPQVQLLREIRDNQLMQTHVGASFMIGFNDLYYSFSPYVADYERENYLFKDATRMLLTPMLTTLHIMTYADSESKVLVYGIMVILLNILIYVGAPAISALYSFRYFVRMNNVVCDAHSANGGVTKR